MAKEKSSLPVTVSAFFATLLSFVLVLLVVNKASIWNQLGTGEKFWTIFASAYSLVLTGSAWVYEAFESRAAGITHAVLMLGVAGVVLYGALSGLLCNPGSDNAAACIVAAANLLFVTIGAIAAVCGLAVMRCLFPKEETRKS